MDLLEAVLRCLGPGAPESDEAPLLGEKQYQLENPVLDKRRQGIVDEVFNLLLNAEKPGQTLQARLNGAVGTEGWTEDIAKGILAALQHAIENGSAVMGPAMQEAVDTSTAAALKIFQFAKDHPIATGVLLTIIALGVLYFLTPWVLEVLGFAATGPVEDSFAAWWQSTYCGYVTKKSLFSFFQRLGMTLSRL